MSPQDPERELRSCYRCRSDTRGLDIQVPNGSVTVCAACAPTVDGGELV